jgi:serpin B
MRTITVLFSIALTIVFYSCEKDDPKPNLTPKNIELSAKAAEVIANSNEFGIELFTKTVEEENGNLMLSPLSASTALTMLLNGCGGDTYSQLKSTLKYPESMTIAEVNEAYRGLVGQLLDADPKVNLSLANAIFYRNGFEVKLTFLNTMSTSFDAYIKGLDFSLPSALTTINGWASDNTNGKIPKVLDEISGDAVMFLMNALYFKGDWSYQFDKSLTDEKPFYFDNGTIANVPTMMGEVGARLVYGDSYKVAELPYGRTNFTMVVMVPNESLESFYNGFTPQTWSSITSSLDAYPEFGTTEVYMPKFKFSYEKYLNDQLISMGMIDAFSPSLADLSGIADASIYVSFVKQNTFVDVNEEGTEAAAVTTIGVEFTSGPGTSVFTIDKPFVFAIRERTTNTLMFIGQVADPR